jgi:hypothetical protein
MGSWSPSSWAASGSSGCFARSNFMIIEMRTYKTKPGLREAFLAIFRAKSMPAHQEIGMTIIGPFLSLDDADTFFFMRGFANLESRQAMRDRFYQSELWTRELEQALLPMLEKYDVVLVDAGDAFAGVSEERGD